MESSGHPERVSCFCRAHHFSTLCILVDQRRLEPVARAIIRQDARLVDARPHLGGPRRKLGIEHGALYARRVAGTVTHLRADLPAYGAIRRATSASGPFVRRVAVGNTVGGFVAWDRTPEHESHSYGRARPRTLRVDGQGAPQNCSSRPP